MDPVVLTLCVTVAALGGFTFSYIAGWHAGAAVAVLSSFVAIGVGLQVPGGIAAGLSFLAVLVAVGLGFRLNVIAALAIMATGLAVTAYANASHGVVGAWALITLFCAVGSGWGADEFRRQRGLALSD